MKLKLRQFFYFSLVCGFFFTVSSAFSENMPPLLLAEKWQGHENPGDYLVSEKLDGVRAYWNGHSLITRGGNKINAPLWFSERFPKEPLDGELWMGHGTFDQVSAAIRRQIPDESEWQKIRYMLFEYPQGETSFEARIQSLQKRIEALSIPWLLLIPQEKIRSHKMLEKRLKAVVAAGGEGLMLHLASAPYVTGRSPFLLKMKPWHDDEAFVMGYLPGKGKYQGMTGALKVRTKAGMVFAIASGLSDQDRRTPPPIGSVITFQYRAFTPKGVPRFARFLRVRDTWETETVK